MIYVEEKDFDRQIELLTFVASSQDLEICAWLYPESKATRIAGVEVSENSSALVPVTTYGDGFSPRHTVLKSASSENIALFGQHLSDLTKNCDSLAVYKKGGLSWLVATIGHEGMCLVQDSSLLNSIAAAGFSASTEAPNWW